MADASDFPPACPPKLLERRQKADPPPAEKSQLKLVYMNLDDLRSAVGVYVLLGNGGAYMYKGSAHDLRKRVTDHMQGRVARTRTRRPLRLIHVEYVADYTEARRRENWLKSGQGRKWLKERYAWVAEWQTHRT
ncbi:MAG: GIY-YIG nuclease family protein [Kiritimatiellia bacterium]|nr:GIY-YIG nuclease family protein [Kiritimatiellia bacterium]